MPKNRRNPDRILRKRLTDLIERDSDIAKEYRENHTRIPKLPVDQMYRVDSTMSRIPTAVCGNALLGLPTCKKGMGKHCYSKSTCGNQYSLTSIDFFTAEFISESAREVSDDEYKRAIEHSREVMEYQRPELETEIDQIVENLMQSIQDEIGGK